MALGGAALRLLGFGLLLLLVACASLPPGLPRPVSEAIPASPETELGRIAAASLSGPDASGFRLMSWSAQALDTRMALARSAQRSLDLQYYVIHDDEVGRHLLRTVREAALRGVRVRLLLDDLYTAGMDPLLLGLAATPNIELRLFNPFPAARGSLLGRFTASLFDQYWNNEFVYPLAAVVRNDEGPELLQRRFVELTSAQRAPEPKPAPQGAKDLLGYVSIAEEMRSAGKIALVLASAEAFVDAPEKVINHKRSHLPGAAEEAPTVRSGLLIRSPKLAEALLMLAELVKTEAAFRVRLSADQSHLQWHSTLEDRQQTLDDEPDTSIWQRGFLWLIGPFVPEALL